MRVRMALGLALLVWLPARCSTRDVVGLFDSLDAMMARSDAVLVVRVTKHIDARNISLPNTGGDWSVDECEVLKTFKGDVPEPCTIRLKLFRSGVTDSVEGFDLYSTHVVFLVRDGSGDGPVSYRSLKYSNGEFQVAPDMVDTRLLEGKPIKECLRLLVEKYKQYRADKVRREDAFFERLLK